MYISWWHHSLNYALDSFLVLVKEKKIIVTNFIETRCQLMKPCFLKGKIIVLFFKYLKLLSLSFRNILHCILFYGRTTMNTLVWRLYKHYLDLYQRTSMVWYTGKVWDKECSRERKAIDNSILLILIKCTYYWTSNLYLPV